MNNSIITGATGFLGSWLALELLENNYEVTVVARNKSKLLPEILKNCFVVESSLEDITAYDFKNKFADLFFHLAWEGVSSTKKNSFDIQLNNIRNSLRILSVAKDIGCNSFIATGTVAEYALCDKVMDFREHQCPNDLYGASKVSAYYYMEVLARQLGMPFIWTIVPSTYGERRDDKNLITYTIKSLINKSKPSFGNLEQMWDFMYVKDVVRALRFIGEKGQRNKVYGIGSGIYRPLKDYVSIIRDLIDPNLPLGIGDIDSMNKSSIGSCVNNYDLKKDTGFNPLYSFEDGIKRTIDYFRNTSEY